MPRRLAQMLFVAGVLAALGIVAFANARQDTALGLVQDWRQRAPDGPIVAEIVAFPGVVEHGQLVKIPPESGVTFDGDGPFWVIVVGTPSQVGDVDILTGKQVRHFDLGFVTSLIGEIPLPDGTTLLLLGILMLVFTPLVNGAAVSAIGVALGGLFGWSALGLAEISGAIVMPGASDIVLASVGASALGALGLRVGSTNPNGFEARATSAVMVAFLVPILAIDVPTVNPFAPLLIFAALLRSSVLASCVAALAILESLQPEANAGLAIFVGCLAFPGLLWVILTPPTQAAFTLPISTPWRRQPEPRPKTTPKGEFDWTVLLEGKRT